MKFAASALLALSVGPVAAFAPLRTPATAARVSSSSSPLFGYLDDLNKYVGTADEEEEEDDSREATTMAEDKKDRFGVGDWSQYVEFQEFDGGTFRNYALVILNEPQKALCGCLG